MPYETLIGALLEEGEAKCKAVLRKAQAEADRVIDEASNAALALGRETDAQVQGEVARRRTEILGRAAISARQILLEAKHEVLEAVWRQVTEKAVALPGDIRRRIMTALLDELLAAASSGSCRAVVDSRERAHLESQLDKRGIPLEAQRRDDLLLGVELKSAGEVLRSSLATRIAKAKPELVMELNRLLFRA